MLTFETMIQFMIHDIFWNAIYYTWNTLYYISLLPFAAIGLILEYVRKLTNKCRKGKEEESPFNRLVMPPPAADKELKQSPARSQVEEVAHIDTPALTSENDGNEKVLNRSNNSVKNRHMNMSPPRYIEIQGDYVIVVDLDMTLVYSKPIGGGALEDPRLTALNDSYLTI